MTVGIIGIGTVGNAAVKGFEKLHQLFLYDKYKSGFSTIKKVAENSEVIFLCVPTPMKRSGAIDLSAIYESVGILNEYLSPEDGSIIVIRSTAVSGSADALARNFPRRKFAVNPEFLRQRSAEEDFMNSKRIVIGANEDRIFEKVKQVYTEAGFKCPIIRTNIKTAEMVKYFSNSFLANQISFANEMFEICQKLDIDYETIKKIILMDERMGTHINCPGSDLDRGFGGRCLPKDLSALIYLAREIGYRPDLLEEVWRTNLKFRKNKDWET